MGVSVGVAVEESARRISPRLSLPRIRIDWLGRIERVDFRASAPIAANYPIVVFAPVRGGVDVGRPSDVRSQLLAVRLTNGKVYVVDLVIVRAIHRVPTDAYRGTFEGISRVGWPVWRSFDWLGRVERVNFRASPTVAANYPVVVFARVRGGVDVGRPSDVRSQLLAEEAVQSTTGTVSVVNPVVVRAIHRVPTDAYR